MTIFFGCYAPFQNLPGFTTQDDKAADIIRFSKFREITTYFVPGGYYFLTVFTVLKPTSSSQRAAGGR